MSYAWVGPNLKLCQRQTPKDMTAQGEVRTDYSVKAPPQLEPEPAVQAKQCFPVTT